jgi:hypothetical protein
MIGTCTEGVWQYIYVHTLSQKWYHLDSAEYHIQWNGSYWEYWSEYHEYSCVLSMSPSLPNKEKWMFQISYTFSPSPPHPHPHIQIITCTNIPSTPKCTHTCTCTMSCSWCYCRESLLMPSIMYIVHCTIVLINFHGQSIVCKKFRILDPSNIFYYTLFTLFLAQRILHPFR